MDSARGKDTEEENRASLPRMSHYAIRNTYYVLNRQSPYQAK
jgi:hypothetical protein